jgi:hypothetical protein
MSKDGELSWQELCERASREQDPQKLLELVELINRRLEDRERRILEKARGDGRGQTP